MFDLTNPTELESFVYSLIWTDEPVPTTIVHAALSAINSTLHKRVEVFARVSTAFTNATVGDDEVEALVPGIETCLRLRLLATRLLAKLDGAKQVQQAFILQMVDERLDAFAEALLMIETDLDEILRWYDLESDDLDHDRWWGRFFSPTWQQAGVWIEELIDEVAEYEAVQRMVAGGASEVKARWCLELAEEALDWRYWRNLGRRQPRYLFENPHCYDDRAVWIEQGSRPLERAVRSLAERMAASRTETLKRFAEFLASRRSPSVEIPEGL